MDAYELAQSQLTDTLADRLKQSHENIIVKLHIGDAMTLRAKTPDMERYDFVLVNPPTDGPFSLYVLWKVVILLAVGGRGVLLLTKDNLDLMLPYLKVMRALVSSTIAN